MKTKAILFDLDGTLLDSVPAILNSFREVFDAMELPFDEAHVRRYIGVPLRVQATAFAGERGDEFIERYKTAYRGYHGLDHALFPGTAEMLDEVRAKGCKTGVVTSKLTASAARTTQSAEIADKFDVVITADDVIHPKPHPEPILKALEMLDVKPEDAIYVGDAISDIESAQKADVRAVAVTWGARSREDLEAHHPNGVFDNWQQFLDWLNGAK